MFRYDKRCLWATLILLLVEVFIALFVHDKIIRPFIGDFLVVMLIYCFIKSFLNISVWKAAILVLLFAYAVELSQYLELIDFLGLENSPVAILILGKSFQWYDLLAYTAGIAFVLLIEQVRMGKLVKNPA